MTVISIIRKLYRVHLYSAFSMAVLLGLIYFLVMPQPFEPVLLDTPVRLAAAALLLFGALGLVLELLLTLAERTSHKKQEADYRLFFLPTYEPLDRTRKPKGLADTVRENRAGEVRIVKDFVAGNGRVLQLTGTAGLGKSSLAALIARRTDFWVNLGGRQISAPELMRILSEWLGDETIATKAAAGDVGAGEVSRICALIAGKPIRLFFNVFDSFMDADGRIADASLAELFTTLLHSDGAHKLVLMSSRSLHSDLTKDLNAAFLPLEELNESAASSLFYSDEAFDNSLDAEEIVGQTGGNPMLLTLLPPILRQSTIEKFEGVRSWFLRSDAPALSEQFLVLAAAVDLRLLQHLSLVAEPMTQSFITAVAQAGGSDDEAIARLQERRLIEWDAGLKKFSLHPAIAAGALHSLEADLAALNEARRLVARVCIAKTDDFKPEEKWASISDCRLLLRAVSLLKSSGDESQASNLGERLLPHLQRWNEAHLSKSLLSETDPLAGSLSEDAQQTAASNLLRRRGAAFSSAGKPGAAIDAYHALLILANKYDRANDHFFAAGRLAELYLAADNPERATSYGNKHLELAKASGNTSLIAAAAGRMGHVLAAKGDYATASRYYNAAVKRFQKAENLGGEAKALGYLARASFTLGHRDNAVEATSRQADLLAMIGQGEDALRARMELAALYRRSGDQGGANAIYEDIVRRAKKSEYQSVAIDVLHELARAAFGASDYPRALMLQHERLELTDNIGDDKSAGVALGMIAHCHVRTKDVPAALKNYAAARERFETAGYRRGIARCGHFSARLLAAEKRWQEALTAVLDSMDYALDSRQGMLDVDKRVFALCQQELGDATFREIGAEQLGENRFAAVLDLMS